MGRAVTLTLLTALAFTPSALADDWLPHPADATWTYEWTDSVYSPTATKEKVTVKEQSGKIAGPRSTSINGLWPRPKSSTRARRL